VPASGAHSCNPGGVFHERHGAVRGWLAPASIAPSAEAAPVTTPPGAYLFRNVRIWDGRSDALYAGEVLVVGNRIQSVSHEAIAAAAELHPITIDGGGRVLMPASSTHTFT